MSTFLKPLFVQQTLLDKNISIFSGHEFSQIFNSTHFQTKHFLETYTKEGLFIRLKRGLYCLKQTLPDEKAIANKLYQPSYISFEYALFYYNIIPEAVYTVTSATTKPTREFNVMNKSFSYHTIKVIAYAGYHAQQVGGITFFIAEKEKTVVDYLYLTALQKKTINDRLELNNLDRKKLNRYIRLYDNSELYKLQAKLNL